MSEFKISEADRSRVRRNFLTSGSLLSATVLMLERPTEIPVCKLEGGEGISQVIQGTSRSFSPMQSREWKKQAKFLVQLAELLVRPEQISWIRLVLPVDDQNVGVVFL